MGERGFHEYLQEVCEPSEVRISVPLPLGAYQRDDGVNFAIFSHQATCVRLELSDGPEDKTPLRVIVLGLIRHRTGDVRHAWVSGPDPAKRDTGP